MVSPKDIDIVKTIYMLIKNKSLYYNCFQSFCVNFNLQEKIMLRIHKFRVKSDINTKHNLDTNFIK